MVKIASILIIVSFICTDSLSQPVVKEKADVVKSQSSNSTGIKIPVDRSANTILKNSDTTNKILLDVLFATNEDCDLYIAGEFKGLVSKRKYSYISLPPGSYIYKAKSKSTLDEMEESFVVKDGDSNEVFIDLLYLIDEKNQERENLKNKANADTLVQVPASNTTIISVPEENKTDNKKEAEKAFINGVVSNMVSINEGSFTMGNNKSPSADEVEHTVTLSPVLFSKYEVTQLEWETVMGYNPSYNKNCNACPVENISWEEAMKFIKKINEIGEKKFRLPTEAEWEYVARIGGRSEIENEGGPEEYIKKTAWYYGNSNKKTHPVGQKQPNVAGIYDLLGNVSEWCSDWYDFDYYKKENNSKNPQGPVLGKEKVVRGGSYNDYLGDRFRPSLRNKLKPANKSTDIGFRLVLEVN
ncbi:MAG: formylglycine-generating enzyme family protein [Chitinophagaceae bacterium]